jgi:hypothetical protein
MLTRVDIYTNFILLPLLPKLLFTWAFGAQNQIYIDIPACIDRLLSANAGSNNYTPHKNTYAHSLREDSVRLPKT